MSTKQQNNNEGTGYQAEQMIVNNATHVYPSLIKNKSIIAEVVNIIADLSMPESTHYELSALPEEVTVKIEYNYIERCKYIIESYKDYTIDLNNVYNTLEQAKPGKKQKLLDTIRDCYKQELSKLKENEKNELVDILVIKKYSDSILENIKQNLHTKILGSSNLDAYNEDVDKTLNLIVADAFIACIILKNPQEAK